MHLANVAMVFRDDAVAVQSIIYLRYSGVPQSMAKIVIIPKKSLTKC